MANYKVVKVYDNSWHVHHGNDTIANIEGVHAAGERPGLIARLFGARQKDQTHYKVTNLAGAKDDPFMTYTAAFNYAVQHHKAGLHNSTPHPMKRVANRLRQLKKAIWASASDPRMTEEDQDKILELAQAHAQTTKKLQQHYPEHM